LKTLLAAAALLAALPALAQAPQPPLVEDDDYVCPDGMLVGLSHDRTAGILRGTRGGETFLLQEQVGRTPPRFVTGSDTIEILKDSIRLSRLNLREQVCAYLPDVPTPGLVHGTIAKLDRMALPEGTRAKVLLVDAARADAPAVELGSTQIVTTGNQVPFHFLIRYDPARTAAPAAPMLQARIESADGKLLYITDTANPLPTQGQPQPGIDLLLRPVAPSK
jgi:uncharacterized lipoprotein YbaY